MVLAVTLLVLTVMVVPILLILALRGFGMKEVEAEEELLSPQAHTVSWLVPEGEDPALVRTRLSHAGFTSVLDHSGDQRLVIACEPGEREQVRAVIAQTDHLTFDGHSAEPGLLRFVDESA